MDTKRIKRLEGGAFTIQTKADRENTATICNHCGIKTECPAASTMKSLAVMGCTTKVTSCERFRPALGFSITAGTDLSIWNTIRLGGAWVKRLDPGMTVSLIDTRAKTVLGEASVLRCERLSLIDAVSLHAKANHAIQAKLKAQKLNLEDVSKEMRRILRNAYGTTYTKDDRDVSVIYLERR